MSSRLPLILGGGGFMGSRLALALLQRGLPVRLFDRLYNREFLAAVETFSGRVELIEGNIESPVDLERAMKGVSAVFHFISSSVPVTSPLRLDVEINVNLPNTLSIIHAMLNNGIERIIYPSSGGAIYGESGPENSKESSPLNPMGAYGMGKLLIEDVLRYYRRTAGLKDLVVRISNAYGAWSRTTFCQGAVDVFINRHAEGQPISLWGDGAAIRDYIYVDDIVEALILLYQRQAHGMEINIGSGVGHSLADVISIIERVSGRPVNVDRMEGMYSGLHRSVLNVERLRTITGFSAGTRLEAGISQCWAARSALRRPAAESVASHASPGNPD